MKLSHPPVLILLDVLFVYLFILILNTSRESIQISPPPDKLFKNAKLLTFKNSKLYEYIVDTKKLVSFEVPEKFNKILDCNNQRECKEAQRIHGNQDEFFILLPKYLFEEMSKVSLIGLTEKECKSLKFDITSDGTIDKEALFQNNKCLKKIPGFKDNF